MEFLHIRYDQSISENMEDILNISFRASKETRLNDKIYLYLAVWVLSLSDKLIKGNDCIIR